MDIIREPEGVDFVVEPVKLTKANKTKQTLILVCFSTTILPRLTMNVNTKAISIRIGIKNANLVLSKSLS